MLDSFKKNLRENFSKKQQSEDSLSKYLESALILKDSSKLKNLDHLNDLEHYIEDYHDSNQSFTSTSYDNNETEELNPDNKILFQRSNIAYEVIDKVKRLLPLGPSNQEKRFYD